MTSTETTPMNVEENSTVEQVETVEITETAEAVQVAPEAVAEITPVAEAAPAPELSNEEFSQKVEENLTDAVDKKVQDEAVSLSNEENEAILSELKAAHQNNTLIDVEVNARVRGGFRVTFKGVNLFLPNSHFSLVRNVAEDELEATVGKTLNVKIIDLGTDENKTIAVSRKEAMQSQAWDKLKVGDKVSGKVTSTPDFGIFIDLGGVEGLIHISRLSQQRVNKSTDIAKIGDTLEAVIIELDKEKNKIGLSRKELEPSPWTGAEAKYPTGTKLKGKVRRITNFGAYVEIEPGIDGLLRFNELSWTKRVKNPGEMLKTNSEIEAYVIGTSEAKRELGLSIKRLIENPWNGLVDSLPKDSQHKGIVSQIIDQGAIITINNEIDGFMPRGRMRGIMNGNAIPFKVGDEVEVSVTELNPAEQNLIFSPVLSEEQAQEAESRRGGNSGEGKGFERRRQENVKIDDSLNAKSNVGFSIGDLLSNLTVEKLNHK